MAKNDSGLAVAGSPVERHDSRMGSKKRRHQAKLAARSMIENDGLSLSVRADEFLLPDMDPEDLPAFLAGMGGIVERCGGCDGLVAYGFTDGPFVAQTMHFGPQECPDRFKVRRLPVQ
jgi:hypothetical protein